MKRFQGHLQAPFNIVYFEKGKEIYTNRKAATSMKNWTVLSQNLELLLWMNFRLPLTALWMNAALTGTPLNKYVEV